MATVVLASTLEEGGRTAPVLSDSLEKAQKNLETREVFSHALLSPRE